MPETTPTFPTRAATVNFRDSLEQAVTYGMSKGLTRAQVWNVIQHHVAEHEQAGTRPTQASVKAAIDEAAGRLLEPEPPAGLQWEYGLTLNDDGTTTPKRRLVSAWEPIITPEP